MNKLLFFLSTIYFFSGIVFGQDPRFRHLTTLDGLNDGTINSIAQDTSGQIWLATWDGLMKYDGYRVINYKPELGDTNSLPAKQCRYIFRDSHDNLWVGTRMGVCRYDQSLDNFIRYELEDFNDYFTEETKMFESHNNLFLHLYDGLYYLSLQKLNDEKILKKIFVFDQNQKVPNQSFNYCKEFSDEIYLCYLNTDSASQEYSNILITRLTEEEPYNLYIREKFVIPGNITALQPDGIDKIYIGTDHGLYIYYLTKNKANFVQFTSGLKISELLISSDHKLWIGTNLSGLGCYDLHTGKFKLFRHDPNVTNSILGNTIFSLFEDFSENLWIGHGGEGLSIVNLRQKSFDTYRYDPNNKNSLSDNTIFCFNETDQEILIGTNYDGLNIMKYDTQLEEAIFNRVEFPNNIKRNNIYDAVWYIAKESNSIFWLGTNFGLIKAEKNKNGWTYSQYLTDLPLGNIRQIFIDNNRNLWLGTYNGLYFIPFSNRDSMSYYHFTYEPGNIESLSDIVITAIILDKYGSFYIGTQNGGLNLLKSKYNTLDLSGNVKPDLRFIRFDPSNLSDNLLNNNEINCLFEHPDGTVWIGTQGGGLNIFDPSTYSFSSLMANDGLPGNDIFGILPDGYGNLWISTNKGLSRFNIFTNEFTNFSPADGIQGNVFMVNSFYKSASGKLYFGGRHGFTCFQPEQITNNDIPPKILLTGIEIFNKPVQIGEKINKNVILPKALSQLKSITLTHKENSFSILFAACHYQIPENNLVEYAMDDGYNKNWNRIPASANFINFSNLPPGQYTLRIRAGNSDNVWTNDYRSLDIKILPPWWGTTIAQIMFGCLFLSVMIGFMLLLLHRQSLKHSLKIEKIEKEKLNELNELKLSFFTNVSHELRTPLSLTLGPIEDLLRRQDSSGFYIRKQLNLAYRNARLLLRLINQIIDFRRLNAGKMKLAFSILDFGNFLNLIIKNFEFIISKKEINLCLNLPEGPFPLWFDPSKMEDILYNLLSNAFKYTNQGGDIIVSLNKTKQKLPWTKKSVDCAQLDVFNSGSQIPADKLDMIFVRFYTGDEKHGGSGIGLAFAKSLVELHHGTISVKSDSEGVTFEVCFPLGDTHLSDEEKVIESYYELPPVFTDNAYPDDQIFTITEKRDNEHNILIIEDNEEFRGFLRTCLMASYNLYEAENGNTGYDLAKEIIPDIIISDVIMPGLNGFQLCDKIKNDLKTCHIPVILLTAQDAEESKIYGFNSGADAYVVKPFERRVLESQIKRLIMNQEIVQEKYRQKEYIIDNSSDKLSTDDQFIVKIRELIEENLADPNFNVNNMSHKLLMSSTQLYRKVKALTGFSSIEFLRIIRLSKAAEMLRENQYYVKEICYMTGFNNSSYFIKCFREQYGMTPNQYIESIQVIK